MYTKSAFLDQIKSSRVQDCHKTEEKKSDIVVSVQTDCRD